MVESIEKLYNNEMKKLLVTMFVTLLMVGFGEDEETTKVVKDDTATTP